MCNFIAPQPNGQGWIDPVPSFSSQDTEHPRLISRLIPGEPRRLTKSSGLVPHLLHYHRIRYWVGYSFVPVFLEVFTENPNFLASQLPADVSASQILFDQQNYQDKQKPFTLYVDSGKVVGKAPSIFFLITYIIPQDSDLVTTESIARNSFQ